MRRKVSKPFCRNGSPGGRASRNQASARQSSAPDVRIEIVADRGNALLCLFCQGGGFQDQRRVGMVARSLGSGCSPGLDVVHDRAHHRNALLERTSVFRLGSGQLQSWVHDGLMGWFSGNCGPRNSPDLSRGVGCLGIGEPWAVVFEGRCRCGAGRRLLVFRQRVATPEAAITTCVLPGKSL